MKFLPTFRSWRSISLPCALILPLVAAAVETPPPQQPQPTANQGNPVPEELTPWPITRYEKMIRKSPFAPATPVVGTPQPPNFAANLYISGLAKIGDRDFVSISSRDQTSKISLFSGDTSSDGIQLVTVQWSDAVAKSKVTVKKGTEFAVLEFDQTLIKNAAPAMPPGVPVPGIGVPPRSVAIPRPPTPLTPAPPQPPSNRTRRPIIRSE